MARYKDAWFVRPFTLGGWGLSGKRERSSDYVVKLALKLEREPDRLLYLELSPDEADRIADNLKNGAKEVRAKCALR